MYILLFYKIEEKGFIIDSAVRVSQHVLVGGFSMDVGHLDGSPSTFCFS